MNNGSNSGSPNSGNVWRDSGVLELQGLIEMPRVAGIGSLVHDFISVGGRYCENRSRGVPSFAASFFARLTCGVTDLIQTSIYEKYSDSIMKLATHLDHISHCKAASDTDWSSR